MNFGSLTNNVKENKVLGHIMTLKGGIMKNKKGLSDVVTVVLVILLALAAVGIIWAFIRPALDTAGSNIDLSTECLKTEVKPVACDATTNKVTVQLAKGDNTMFVEIIAIVEKSDGSTKLGKISSGFPELLGTKDITNVQGGILKDEKARATVVLKNEEGQTYTCDPSPAVVTCIGNEPPPTP